MKRNIHVRLLIGITLFLILSTLSVQTIVLAEGAVTPFKVNCVTYPEVNVIPGYLVLRIPAECGGTHLGESDWYADSVVDITTFPALQTGDMVFTAANGSQLFGSFNGYAVPNDIGGFDYWGDYEITEGTGRFSGATGSGTYYGGADGTTGVLTFEGTLIDP